MLDRRQTLDSDGSATCYVTCEHCKGVSKGWLARISLAPYGARWDLTRQFVPKQPPGRRDRHLHRYVLSEPWVYEADSVLSASDSKSQRVYFELASDGSITLLGGRKAAIERLTVLERRLASADHKGGCKPCQNIADRSG